MLIHSAVRVQDWLGSETMGKTWGDTGEGQNNKRAAPPPKKDEEMGGGDIRYTIASVWQRWSGFTAHTDLDCDFYTHTHCSPDTDVRRSEITQRILHMVEVGMQKQHLPHTSVV